MIIRIRVKDFDYEHWLAVASRYSRRKSEAEDLLHDAILDAIRAGRDELSSDATKRWFAGVIRNRAAMTARTAGRRQKREAAVATRQPAREAIVPDESFIVTLAPSARRVATLIVAGLNREEIIAALRIAPTAFRQRLTTIRRAWQKRSTRSRDEIDRTSPFNQGTLDLGLMRRALLSQVRRVGGVGTHDPDGHLLVFADHRSQTTGSRQQSKKKEKR